MAHTIHQTLNTGPHDNTGATSQAFSSNPTAGRSVIVVGWGWNAGNFGISSVTDNQGGANTYTVLTSSLQVGMRTFVAYCHAITASGTFTITVTPTIGSTNYYHWSALEVSNLQNAAHDQTASNNGGLTTTPSTGTTGTTAQNDELAIAALVFSASQASVTVGGSWTQIQEQLDAIAHQGGENDRLDLTTTGTQSAAWTLASNAQFSAIIVTFLDQGVGAALAGSSTVTIAGGALNYGAAALAGSSTLTTSGSYTPPVGAALAGDSTLDVTGTYISSASVALRGVGQLLITPNGAGVSASVALPGTSTLSIYPEPQTTPAAALAPYGGLSDLSALITGSGGGFLFEQQPYSPYPIENIEWERSLPGGDTSATITTRFNGVFQLPSLYSTVILSDLVGPWWLGILDAVDIEYWNPAGGVQGANVVLRCVGFSAIADDLVYVTRTVFDVGDTAGDLFRHARDHLCPGISATDAFIAASAETALDVETKSFRGDSALAVWNTAAALGSTYADADPLIWKVRAPMGDPGPATVPILEVYAVPDAPTYTIDLADGYSVRTKIERQQVRNRIIVNYGMGGTGDVLNEPAEQNALAEAFSVQGWAELNYRERHMWVDSSSEFRAAPFLAQRVADANLAKYGVVHGSGATFNIPFDGTGAHPIVVGAGPDTAPIWRIDVGYALTVDNDQSWAGIPNNPAPLITHVRGSLKEGQIQVTTGVLGDSRQARRMTGVATLRQALDLPSLSRPNRPEEWQRINIECLKPADDDMGFVLVEFPHIIRTITVLAQPLAGEDAAIENVDVLVGVGPQASFPAYDTLVEQSISDFYTQVMNGMTRRVDPGAAYIFYFRNPDPAGIMVLAQVGVDRIKVVE